MAFQISVKSLPYLNISNSLLQRNCRRLLTRASQRFYAEGKEVTPVAAENNVTPQAKTDTQKIGPLTSHRVDRFERYLLVWGGKYKKVADVPNLVSQDTMERARNKARIKISTMIMIGTLGLCLVMVMSGKKAQREGQSVAKMNEEWHRKINEESKEKS